MTESAGTLWKSAFAQAQAEFPTIHKGKTVNTGTFSYNYADLPSILEAINPILKQYGFAVGQAVVSEDGKVGVETRIYHKGGHVEVFGPVLLPAGGDARSAGSAITYARRYSLCAALGIAADEDDDGAAASASKKEAAQPKAAQPVSDNDPHCPACLVLTGELVGVNRLQGGDKKPWWKCVKESSCAGAQEAKNGKVYGWSGWHDSFRASSEEWLQKNGYEGAAVADTPAVHPGVWMQEQVQALKGWSKEQRKQAYDLAVDGLKLREADGSVDLTLEKAQAIFDEMHMAWSIESEAPF